MLGARLVLGRKLLRGGFHAGAGIDTDKGNSSWIGELSPESATGSHLVKSNLNSLKERGVVVSSTFHRFEQVCYSGSQ